MTCFTRCDCVSMGKSRAFTLIELLIVISIIVILAAMLLPALSRTKEKAKRVLCMNNQHQLGITLSKFATDKKNRLPLGYHVGTKQSNYLTGKSSKPCMIGLLQPMGYFPAPEILYCPSSTFEKAMFDTTSNPWIERPSFAWARAGYSIRPVVDWGNGLDFPKNLPKLTEFRSGTAIMTDMNCSLEWNYSKCHKEGVNALEVSGAVIWIRGPEFMSTLASQSGPGWSAGNNAKQDLLWQTYDENF